jgi:hypothetical protein
MANTYVVTPIESDERLAQFRSTDYDPIALVDRYGAVAVYDLTDGMRPVAYLHEDPDGRVTELTASGEYRTPGVTS